MNWLQKKMRKKVERYSLNMMFGWKDDDEGRDGQKFVSDYEKAHIKFIEKHWHNAFLCLFYYWNLMILLKTSGYHLPKFVVPKTTDPLAFTE